MPLYITWSAANGRRTQIETSRSTHLNKQELQRQIGRDQKQSWKREKTTWESSGDTDTTAGCVNYKVFAQQINLKGEGELVSTADSSKREEETVNAGLNWNKVQTKVC